MRYLLGLDVGTSGVKALLLSEEGKLIKTCNESYPLSTPSSGWAEQNPADWWEAVVKVINKIIKESNIRSENIAGISLSGQMHSSVFLDDEMEVIRPAILWSDTRTAKQCKDIQNKTGGLKKLIKKVSNPALEGFTAPKILWLKENEPDNYQKVNYVLMPKDFIRFKLTGEINTEVSDAAGTLLFYVKEKKWSEDIIEMLGLNGNILPPVIESIDIGGKINEITARKTPLKRDTPVIAGGADNACGAVGSGIIKEGRVMVSIGSSGVVLAQTNQPTADKKGRIHLFNHSKPDSWYMMGVMLSAGLSFNWLKNSLFDDHLDYEKLNKKADDVEAGSEGLIFLPYLYGERTPHGDADARGVFFGISGRHTQGHFIRSVMEGVTFGLKDSFRLIKKQNVKIKEIRAIGGGAKSKVWQQILADILGHPINLLNVEEGPAYGAAIIAGVGVGVFKSFEEVSDSIIKVSEQIKPNKENVKRYKKYYEIYRELYPSLKKEYKKLSKLN
ncbi:MAG: xylulokinase [Candidatus Cloacimonetes bacterium]|nr:xylulokinase [Candidatus Cloacimonadota bacterium]